jgi:two-component system NtrC family sensor kinase
MISLPLFPIWIVDILGSALILLLSWQCLGVAWKAMRRDPENALWLFIFWLALAFFFFACSRCVGHILNHILVFSGYAGIWRKLRPISGSLNTIAFVLITTVILCYHHIERIYRRMILNHCQLETTTRGILQLNREVDQLKGFYEEKN